MSTPGNGQPQVPQLPLVALMKCNGCGQEINTKIPRPRILNATDMTIIAIAHEKLDRCPHCGAEFLFTCQFIDEQGRLGLMWVPIKTEQSAIIPGTSNNLAQAVNNEQVVKKIKIN